MKKFVKISAVGGLLCASGMASAGLSNAGFETGDLTGWTDLTDHATASVVTSHSGFGGTNYGPKEGTQFLEIGVEITGDADKDDWKEVTQQVALSMGDTLSGWAAFDWGDEAQFLPNSRDGARVQIRDAQDNVVETPFSEDGTGQSDNYDGPWTEWSWTATAAGTYTVAYGAINTHDAFAPPFALFDTVSTQTPPPPPPQGVPEPATLALLGLGLAGLGAARRRQRS